MFKKDIDHFGEHLDQAIQVSGKEIDARIAQVGTKLEEAIARAGNELSTQRTLTKDDVEHLIRYATVQFGAALDARIYKIFGGVIVIVLVIAGCWGVLNYATR